MLSKKYQVPTMHKGEIRSKRDIRRHCVGTATRMQELTAFKNTKMNRSEF
jgi:hypothetical protein